MRSLFVLLISCLFLISGRLLSQPPIEPTWYPYWPFSMDTGIDEVHIGYGDWCTISEGPHPGIDFGDPDQDNGTMVYSPCRTAGTVEWAGHYIDNTPGDPKGMVVCVAKPGEDWGWGVAHLDKGDDPDQYDEDGEIPAFAPMEITFDMSQSNPDWRHVHLYWIERFNSPTTETRWGEGYFNPFYWMSQDPDLRNDLIGYDEVCFGSPQYVEESSLPNNGIYFSPDGAEHPTQFNLSSMTWLDFQETVFGQVDASVRPYSAFQGVPGNDTCGVNTVGYKILWQNPYNGRYVDLDEDSISIFGGDYRLLVRMNDGEMSYSDSDEYRAVYLDGLVTSSGDPQLWDGFNSSYILTNSGTETLSSALDGFNSGWDNVWTSSYSRTADYVYGEFLRGAWDTRLRFGSSNASDANSHSVFPDGRYAFEVRALSQATAFLDPEDQEWSKRILPSDNLDDPDGAVRGIIVDNFLPYVDSVIVYSKIPGDFSAGKLYFTAGWNENYSSSSASYDSTVSGYLLYGSEQQLRKRLYVAVKYSEPCSLSVNDVWITAEMENEETWHSVNDWGCFEPEPITVDNWIRGLPDMSQHSGFWALYKLKPAGTPMDSYKGELTLGISGDITDLEGNHIDADPSTIVPPRDAQGNWDTANYETGDDESYSWGIPEWSCTETPEDAYFIAEVGDDQVYSIALSYIDQDWMYWWETAWVSPTMICDVPFTPCTYNCGIWIERLVGNIVEDTSYYHSMDITLIKPDNETPVVIDHMIEDGHPFNWFQWYTYTYHNSDAALFYGGEGNRYFWMRDRVADGEYPVPQNGVSSEQWYCADAVTGTYIHRRLLHTVGGLDICDTWYSHEDSTVYYVNCNYSEMEEYMQPDGDMLVPAYYVFYDDPTPVFMDSVLIPAPTRDYRSIQEDQRISSVSDSLSDGGRSVILPPANPTRGEVTLSVLNCIGEEYEIHMYDLLGRELSAQYGTVFANEEMLHISTAHIPDGMYLVTVVVGDQKLVQKVTVLR